jgi:hypothetical protein
LDSNSSRIDTGTPGHLYEVEIPDDITNRMLDWDAPLSEQPESVRKAVANQFGSDDVIWEMNNGERVNLSQMPLSERIVNEKLFPKLGGIMDTESNLLLRQSGANFYQDLATRTGGQDEASKALAEAGIPGIRFFDGGSRRAGDGTRNIVVFNPDDITQVKRDGELVYEQASRITPPEKLDPRFDNRVTQRQRARDVEIGTEGTPAVPDEFNIADLEGETVLTTMADRSAAGDILTDINGVELFKRIPRTGGQGFMFENPGQVWANGRNAPAQILKEARRIKAETGKDPLILPWRMAPSATDFQIMQGETMLAYASANMRPGAKRSLNAALKKFIPGWKGVDNPESFAQYRQMPDKIRKNIKAMMDVNFRDRGGLTIGEARVAISDPKQFNRRESGVQNVGRIFSDQELTASGNVTFPIAIPGEGLGTISEDVSIFELLPDLRLGAKQERVVDPLRPTASNNRAMQMGPKSGIITPEIIQRLMDRGVKVNSLPLVGIIGAATAYGMIEDEQGEL